MPKLMNPSQELHLEEILGTAKSLISTKYRAGQAKHGGNLFDLTASQLIDEAIMECIDQITYLLTAKAKLNDFKSHNFGGTDGSGLATMAVRTEPELPEANIRSVGVLPANENLY